MKIAVTGAAGFLGRAVIQRLAARGAGARAIVRASFPLEGASETWAVGDLIDAPHAELFADCDAVIHCAARVHVTQREPLQIARAAYDRANRELSLRLALAARGAGVRRFVHLSSLAAVCSTTGPGQTVDDSTAPRPSTPYGESKLAADRSLTALAGPEFAVICLRPPTIFGPGVGALFAQLLRAARLGLPLPFGAIENRRSFAYVDNIADATVVAAMGPQPPSGAYLVTDSQPLSTANLYDQICGLYGHRRRALRWPPAPVRAATRLVLGSRAASAIGDAACSGDRFSAITGWTPVVDWDTALVRTATAGICRTNEC